MSGGGVGFQTPTALYSSIAGQPGYGTLFPAAGQGWPGTTNTGNNSAFSNAFNSINGLIPGGPAAVYDSQNQANANAAQVGNTIPQVIQAAFDPQNALYSKLYQQNQDQANAQNAMSGVATTPYGAALADQSGQNFNLNWQNQQLARMGQGANTIASLMGTATTPVQSGQTAIQDYLNYIGSQVNEGSAISGATNQATSAGAQSTNSLAAAEQANNAGKGGIGSALSGIGGLAGKFASGGKG